MAAASRIAVTGARGRLGRALLAAAPDAIAWHRPDYDLDDPDSPGRLLDRDKPDLVIHAAAWTDVDGCARDPELAFRRNGHAVDALARACLARGAGLLLVSTNEVFDGERTDGQGYREHDSVNPRNPYGVSKLLGETSARQVFGDGPDLWIVRTAWLYGPPGNDFPTKITAAADRLPRGDSLAVVDDETGSPTYSVDLAAGILWLLDHGPGGIYHVVNAGAATRYEVSKHIIDRLRPDRTLRPISGREFSRASQPPQWAVLDGSAAAAIGIRLRAWQEALDSYLATFATNSP